MSRVWSGRMARPSPQAAMSATSSRLEVADIAACGLGLAILPDHTLDIDVPDHRGAAAQFVDDLFAGFDDCHAGGEGNPRAAGHVSVADRGGVGDDRANLVVVDAQGL